MADFGPGESDSSGGGGGGGGGDDQYPSAAAPQDPPPPLTDNPSALPNSSAIHEENIAEPQLAEDNKPPQPAPLTGGIQSLEKKGSGVCRYAPGYWLSCELEPSLVNDITNYPAEIREDILASILSAVKDGPAAAGDDQRHRQPPPTHKEDCKCTKHCMLEALASAFGFRDSDLENPRDSVQPWNLLPRFFWYKHELLKLHGSTAIVVAEEKSSRLDLLDSDDDESAADEIEELFNEDQQQPGVDDQDVVMCTETDVDITDDVVKGKSKKRITVIKQQSSDPQQQQQQQFSAADTLASTNALKNSHTDSFSAAIRDLQFRLNRHGFLADPKTYLGKGRGEEMYDKNDSLFDEDECVPVLESEDSDADSADRSLDALEDDMELLYQEGEHLFVMDDESESEEEQVIFASRQSDSGARVVVQCNFLRPLNFPCQYNPRGWRQPARKINEPGLPKVLRIFLQTLEYVISHKRTQILQRRIIDTYEFIDVDPDDPQSLKLSSVGIEQLTYILNLIFETALLSFLLPHTPSTKKESKFLKYLTVKAPAIIQQPAVKNPDTELPVIMESLTTSDNPPPTINDTDIFMPVNRQITALLQELCSKYISPILPSTPEFYRNIWIPIGEYVVTVMDHYATLWLQDIYDELCDLFSDSGDRDIESIRRLMNESLTCENESETSGWRRFVNTTTSIRFFTSIDQRLTALNMMVKEECEPEMIEIFASDLIELQSTLPTHPVNEVIDLDAPPEDSKNQSKNDWHSLEWTEIACAIFVEGLKFWFEQRQVIEQNTSPTTVPSGAAQPAMTSHSSQNLSSSVVEQWIPDILSLLRNSVYKYPADLQIRNVGLGQVSVMDYFSKTSGVVDQQQQQQQSSDCRNLILNQSPSASANVNGNQAPQKRRRESERAVSAPVDDLMMNRPDMMNSEHQSQNEKKKRVRVLVTDILQTHFTRIIDLLQASPLLLPIPFGVALQCSNAKPSSTAITSHMMLVELHKFASVHEIELKLLHIDPPLPPDVEEDLLTVLSGSGGGGGSGIGTKEDSAGGGGGGGGGVISTTTSTGRRASKICDLPYITSFSDFLDQVHGVKRLSVEGRTRSLVFAGFDNRTKSFGLLCFPLQYPSVTCNSGPGESVRYMNGEKLQTSELKREDFISTAESSTVKGRLSLLDFLTLHLWLQIYAQITPQPSTLQLNLVFRNNKDIMTSKVSQALWKALMAGGDLQKEWKVILDRYSFSQLAFLKKWIHHLNKIYDQKQSINVPWKTFGAPA